MSENLFDTPVFVFDVPGSHALTGPLQRLLTEEARASAGIQVSNRGGWHSVPDLALREDPVYRDLSNMFVEHFRYVTEYTARRHGTRTLPSFGLSLTMWAMVMERGDYTILHDHPEATWSSAFYVDAGDPAPPDAPHAGTLTFVDPRRASSPVIGLQLFPTEFTVPAATGRLVIFPGYLQHYVHAYLGDRPRISIAANASVRVTGPPRGA